MSSGGEGRKSERIQFLGEFHGEVMVLQPFAIKGISRGGIEIESGFALQPDFLHDFRLALGERSVVVKGRVVRCAITDVDQDVVLYRSGIEFVEPPLESTRSLPNSSKGSNQEDWPSESAR
jgi:hypothetical protein